MALTPQEIPDGCEFCDTFGGEKTYRNQVQMPLNGRVRGIDRCIHHIVAALNAANVRTVASCCGHGQMDGCIVLDDGRELVIRKYDESNYVKRVDA